ncbi:hypothetical protein RND81_06G062900 [Saponaria officinalis]|uniref:Uncharacterized protein n=1 Tax=Saponaria officinalis TaxID=3572 RepID=A0AAW1K7B6_SAPOF
MNTIPFFPLFSFLPKSHPLQTLGALLRLSSLITSSSLFSPTLDHHHHLRTHQHHPTLPSLLVFCRFSRQQSQFTIINPTITIITVCFSGDFCTITVSCFSLSPPSLS